MVTLSSLFINDRLNNDIANYRIGLYMFPLSMLYTTIELNYLYITVTVKENIHLFSVLKEISNFRNLTICCLSLEKNYYPLNYPQELNAISLGILNLG